MSSFTTVLGKVKWFNSRAGYGFITVISDEHKGQDIFVHHSSLKCNLEQYKYLVQGEYVEFVLTETNDATHKYQADNVTGVYSHNLMCETRNGTMKRSVNHTNYIQTRRSSKKESQMDLES